MNKKLKITFAPGAFDSFEGSQEELDQLVDHIEKMAESGDLHENSEPVDMDRLEQEDPELYDILTNVFEKLDNEDKKRRLH